MRFLLGMLLAVRGIERNGSRRLPQLWGRDPEVAEKLDGHTSQLSHVEVELAALADGNRREHEALAMIAGEFRRLREEEQTLRRRQAESLEVAAVALTRLSERLSLEKQSVSHDDTGMLRAQLDDHRAELAAREEELSALRERAERHEAEAQELREVNARVMDELRSVRSAHAAAKEAHDGSEQELQTLRDTHHRTEQELQTLRDTHHRTEQELQALRETHHDTQEELATARAECDKTTRRLASSHVKLRRLREELEIARMPWWRRRRDGAGARPSAG